MELPCNIKKDAISERLENAGNMLDCSNVEKKRGDLPMNIQYSARNQLRARVKSITFGEIMAEVVMDEPAENKVHKVCSINISRSGQ